MDSSEPKPAFPWLFFAPAFAFTWSFWVPIALSDSGWIELPASIMWLLADGKPAAWGPLIAAIVVSFLHAGRAGVVGLLASMVRVKFGWRWYAAALLTLPAILGTATLIALASGDAPPFPEALANPISIPIAFVWIFLFGGPLQEEAGWRGTATTSLQPKFGALVASLFTGAVWAIWHLPLFYQPRAEIYYNQPFWGLLASTMMLSVLITWVYNNTGRSLFAAMLMHTSWNWANYVFSGLQTASAGLAFLILMAATVATVVVRFGPRELAEPIQDMHPR